VNETRRWELKLAVAIDFSLILSLMMIKPSGADILD
jgi:hypothetical protein